jgi:hypothetical protein
MDLRNVYLSKQCVLKVESRRFCDGETCETPKYRYHERALTGDSL